MGRRAKELSLTVEALAIGGYGIGRANGLVVFLPYVVPGERVRVLAYKKKKGYLLGRPIAILERSPERVEPACRYFGTCGGCLWQHMDYNTQLFWKTRHVQEALRRIGGLSSIELRPTIGSPKVFRYRNKIELSFGQQGGDEGIEPILGFHKRDSYYKLVPVKDCLLSPEAGKKLLSVSLEFVKENRISIYDNRTHSGLMRFLMLRYSFSSNEAMINIITSKEDGLIKRLAQHLLSDPPIRTIVNNINPKLSATSMGEKEILLWGDGYLDEIVLGKVYRITANSFFQVNSFALPLLLNTIYDFSDINGNEKLVDAYCGIGTIGIFLADKVKEVIGIELIPANTQLASINMELNGINNMQIKEGKTEEILKDVLTPDSLLILDPPRAGLHKEVVKAILDIIPKKMVYVSCNPATLARDLSYLKEKYAIGPVQPIDMFPQTPHIETIVALKARS